jgi:hypothetical protein
MDVWKYERSAGGGEDTGGDGEDGGNDGELHFDCWGWLVGWLVWKCCCCESVCWMRMRFAGSDGALYTEVSLVFLCLILDMDRRYRARIRCHYHRPHDRGVPRDV